MVHCHQRPMVYKRGKYYWFKFQWKGQMMYFSTGQGDARVATNLESKKRIELAEGRAGIKKKKHVPTLRAYLKDSIVPWAEAQFVGVPKSLKWYRNEARVLSEYKPLADAPLDQIKESLLAGFKSWRLKQKKSISTVNSSIRVLRSCLNHAIDDGLIEVAPKLRVLKGANVRKWVLPPDQEASYLAACTEPLRTIAVMILDAGLRPNECFRLRWENVRWVDDQRAFLNVLGTKTASASRRLPMTPRLHGILLQRWQAAGKPASGWVFPATKATSGHMMDNTVYQPHRNAVEASKINSREFVLYSLRHTCLTRWGDSGMDAWTLARFAGHGNIRQSMTYVHPSNMSLPVNRQSLIPAAQGGDVSRDNEETAILEVSPDIVVTESIVKS